MTDEPSPFHRGEKAIQTRLGVAEKMEEIGRRMIRDHMPAQHQEFFNQLPLLLIGSADMAGRPWASALVGEPGFVRALDDRRLKIEARPVYGDPLQKAIVEGAEISALELEFPTRRRNRVNGRIARVAVDEFEIEVRQSFGNCPKYIQARVPELGPPRVPGDPPPIVRRGTALSRDQSALIARADTFFIASQSGEDAGPGSRGQDVSHRGGRPGFVVVAHETLMLFPDYAGNCMFNTFGNIELDPRTGLLFFDFETGDTLQLTGEAEILWEPYHASRFPGAKRVIAFQVEEVLQIERALPFSWRFQDYSPVFDDFDEPADESERAAAGRLLSVNLSMPRGIEHQGKSVETGIYKRPAEGRVMLRRLNLEGDGQADLWGHGGAFRAVYAYDRSNFDYWGAELGRDDFEPGQFGENFTVEGLPDDEVRVGDVYSIGEALVEVSQPRIPCYKLAIKMRLDGFQNRFLRSGRIGFYFRVLEEGEVGAGDAIERVRRSPEGLTVRRVSDLLYFDKDDLDSTRTALQIPALSHGWKGSFAERLAKAGAMPKPQPGLLAFVVDAKQPESETITSFYLKPADGGPIDDFLPGQFLTFELDLPGQAKPLIRTYSLSDGPHAERYRISVKREPAPAPADAPELPPGLSSNFLHDHVSVGTELMVGRPRGKFHLDPARERAVVLLSAGVGLTPMISMLNGIVGTGSERQVWFLHGARNGREHAFGAHVRELAARHQNVQVHVRYSQPEQNDREGRDYDSSGRIDLDLLKAVLPFDSYDFYICGPSPFMRGIYCELLGSGVAEDRIHYEFFGPGSILQDEAEAAVREEKRSTESEVQSGIAVTFARSGVSVPWDPAQDTLLDLAESVGLTPDYSCRSGICHTCLCALIEGEVEYLEEPLEPPPAGATLICCARPKTDVVLEA